jgi:hypothetical protein
VITLATKCLLFISIFITGVAHAEQYPYWDQFANFLKENKGTTKTLACPQPTNKSADVFPVKDPQLTSQCVAEICGLPDWFRLLGLSGRPKNSVDFATRYKEQIAAAAKNVAKNEPAWLQQQIRELDRKRPFKELSTEEQILSSYSLLPSIHDRAFAESLTAEELDRFLNLQNNLTPFSNRFTTSYQRNLQAASTKTSAQIRFEVEQLNSSLKRKFADTPLWNELRDVVEKSKTAMAVEAAANSAYYRAALVEQYLNAKTLAEALYNKDQWKPSLGDLGNPAKEFPSLKESYVANSKVSEGEVLVALQNCADEVSNRHAQLPTAAKLEVIKDQIEATKQKIKKSFLPRFSLHSQKAMRDALENTTFNLPPSQESYEAAFNVKMEAMAKAGSSRDSKQTQPSIVYDFQRAQGIPKYIGAQCDAEVLPDGRDHTLYALERINLSELATKNDFGAVLIAHELFHLLDPAMTLRKMSSESSAEMSKIKSCLADYRGKNSFYLTEDWADANAAFITSDVKRNVWCDSAVMPSSFNPDDNHSPALFRLLHFQMYKEKGLGPLCTKFLAKQKPAVVLKKCL